jgi:hypothetical protein
VLRRALPFLLLAFAACDPYAAALGIASDTDAGGAVNVTLGTDPTLTAPGVAHFDTTSLTIDASTNAVVVGLTAGDDALGNDAKTELAVASATIILPITPTSRTQLQLSLEQKTCTATSGTITLSSNTTSQVSGSWNISGTFANDTPCTSTGTLTNIPEQH